MQYTTRFDRPRRHKIWAIAWRIGGVFAASYAWHYGYGEILAALVLIGCGLIAVLHDIVSAMLPPAIGIKGGEALL